MGLDCIEKIILENKFEANQSIKIGTLNEILKRKLNLSNQLGVDFARFLIEEQDEENPQESIQFDLNRCVNSQYIPVRLMTNFKKYPAVYTNKQEFEAKLKFKNTLDEQATKKLIKKINC